MTISQLPMSKLKAVKFIDGKYVDDRQIGDKAFLLEKDYSVLYVYKDSSYKVTCKSGFIYDGFSTDFLGIPRIIQGKHTGAVCGALLHDLDYCSHFSGSRSQADWNLLITCKDFGYWWMSRNLIYTGVRAGGWAVYPKNENEINESLGFVKVERYE